MARTGVHDLDDGALVEQVAQSKDELFRLRFQLATGQLTNHARIGQARREIARLETELRAREIAAAEALEAQALEGEADRGSPVAGRRDRTQGQGNQEDA